MQRCALKGANRDLHNDDGKLLVCHYKRIVCK
jgi:hypothetical protein